MSGAFHSGESSASNTPQAELTAIAKKLKQITAPRKKRVIEFVGVYGDNRALLAKELGIKPTILNSIISHIYEDLGFAKNALLTKKRASFEAGCLFLAGNTTKAIRLFTGSPERTPKISKTELVAVVAKKLATASNDTLNVARCVAYNLPIDLEMGGTASCAAQYIDNCFRDMGLPISMGKIRHRHVVAEAYAMYEEQISRKTHATSVEQTCLAGIRQRSCQ